MADRPTSDDSIAPVDRKEVLHPHDGEDTYLKELIASAKSASDLESKMTLREGLRYYYPAIFYSVVISTCIVMEGYDICLLSNFCKWGVCHV